MRMRVEAFTQRYESQIPEKYTCDGESISPGIIWDEVPGGTKSFAVIMEGMDTPDRSNPLVLWLVYNISANIREIKTDEFPQSAQLGTNDLGKQDYSGPCPKPGPDHQRYSVQLYALDALLDLDDGATIKEFLRAAKDHILDQIEIIGMYERYKK